MTTYSELSKKIGWEKGTKVSIPSLEEARELHNEVLLNHDVSAYEQVFRIARFAPNPDGGEDEQAYRLIYEAFSEGRRLFE